MDKSYRVSWVIEYEFRSVCQLRLEAIATHGQPLALEASAPWTTYDSAFAPKAPPTPIEIIPATSSATPPSTTIWVLPRVERPAVRAKGTVMPSANPMMASEIILGVGRKFLTAENASRMQFLIEYLEFAFGRGFGISPASMSTLVVVETHLSSAFFICGRAVREPLLA